MTMFDYKSQINSNVNYSTSTKIYQTLSTDQHSALQAQT